MSLISNTPYYPAAPIWWCCFKYLFGPCCWS